MSIPNSIPEGLDVVQVGDGAVISRRWFSHTVWFLVFFCAAWDSFLVFWYGAVLGHGIKGSDAAGWFAVVFPIGHLAIGVGLTYFVLCTFLNRTDVTLSESRVTVRTHPLPWLGNKTVEAAELTRFLIRYRSGQNNSGTFHVLFVNSQNQECTLVKGLPREEQAEYVANALTRFYVDKRPAA